MKWALVFGDDLPAIITGMASAMGPMNLAPNQSLLCPSVQLDDGCVRRTSGKWSEHSHEERDRWFRVAFENIGVNEKRAKYDKERKDDLYQS